MKLAKQVMQLGAALHINALCCKRGDWLPPHGGRWTSSTIAPPGLRSGGVCSFSSWVFQLTGKLLFSLYPLTDYWLNSFLTKYVRKSQSVHTVRNFHFLSKNSTLICQENCRFFWLKNSGKCCGFGLFSCWPGPVSFEFFWNSSPQLHNQLLELYLWPKFINPSKIARTSSHRSREA